MKAEELHSLSDSQLREDLENFRKELFNLRFQIETRKIKNHQRIPAVKKDIARVMTVLRERDLMRQYGGVDVEPVPDEAQAPETGTATRRRGLLGRSRASKEEKE